MIFRVLILFLFLWESCAPRYLTGGVVRVADGDTFTLLIGKNQQRIRLYGIDCPERGQPYNRVATAFTKELLSSGPVKVREMDIDRYGRVVGIVYIADTINLNERLLEAGLAWHCAVYDRNPLWMAKEQEAREARRGLWTESGAVAPWHWRKGEKTLK
ncbi:endonuclease [Parapedobacter defluvii]|uniref:Endonuclease n=1 Tax=Parapedobacter defluvii TaxID=2045106 RepID=A0ABQ1MX74_9SPHI|nr:thermonuclease family protein [Parapedobacter defluvii]GGC48563.1 endonuclease [Parapedobacter defluvii]